MEVGKVRRREEWEASTVTEKRDSSSESGGGAQSSDVDNEELIRMLLTVPTSDESDDGMCFCNGCSSPAEEYRSMTSDEHAKYSKQALESEGFDIDPFPVRYSNKGLIIPCLISDYCSYLVEFAIQRNKETEGNNLKLVRVIKCNREDTPNPYITKYYLTFEAEDVNTAGVDTYQAKVVVMAREEEFQVPVFRVRSGPLLA